MGTPDAIRVNRVRLGLTQAQLARDINVDTRQINRYEIGETEPTLAIARRLADRLRISMDELAGGVSPLNGIWYSAWHNLTPDGPVPTGQTQPAQGPGSQPGFGPVYGGPVELAQQGRHLTIQPLRGRTAPHGAAPPGEGELVWSAEVFVDLDTLLGGFKIEQTTLRRRGLLNLTHRDSLIDGTWVRVAVTGSATGKLTLARDPDQAYARLQRLLEE